MSDTLESIPKTDLDPEIKIKKVRKSRKNETETVKLENIIENKVESEMSSISQPSIELIN